jgi:3-hydroxyisobutyrate dehydrogenase-like beta-hydroxyacid dehydrogenase
MVQATRASRSGGPISANRCGHIVVPGTDVNTSGPFVAARPRPAREFRERCRHEDRSCVDRRETVRVVGQGRCGSESTIGRTAADMSTSTSGVTVIGLGPMGQAMVRSFLAAGHPTTVWNRTAARADELVAAGAARAATVADAVAANELVVLSLTDYRAMYEIFDGVGDALRGRVVANLSSDTPDVTRVAATWLAERGAELVTGGVMAPADLVGKDGASVFYSGPRSVFDAHAVTLQVIGRTDYLGADHGLAQLYYQAQLQVFLTSLATHLQTFAMLAAAGVSAHDFLPHAVSNANDIAMFLPSAAQAADEGRHPGDLASVIMMGATADHVVGASLGLGIDTALPDAVKSLYDRAIARGHGKDSWTSLIEVIKKP